MRDNDDDNDYYSDIDLVDFLHDLSSDWGGDTGKMLELAALELASLYRQVETLTFDLAEARGETVHHIPWEEPG